VATINAPADPAHVVHQFDDRRAEIERDGEAEVSLAGRPFTIRKSFLDDIASNTLDDRLARLQRALLVLHAPRDATVGIENAGRIFANARHPKSFITLDDADHLLSKPADAEYAATMIAAWAMRYLPPSAPVASPESGVHVSEAGTSGFLNTVSAPRNRAIVADEPVKVGGTDEGLTPFELVGAGLGACTTMTMRMYANRKGWPAGAASTHVTWSQTDRHNSVFHREITLSGDLTDEQRARLIEIADRCPVHRMLEGTITVETRNASDD
jgi:putative redox protein